MLDRCFSLRRVLPLLIMVASGASRCLGQSLFQGHQVVNPGGGVTSAIVVGHFNGHSPLDLAIAMGLSAGYPSGVSVLLGNGNGAFSFAGVFAGESLPGGLPAGDFKGMGR